MFMSTSYTSRDWQFWAIWVAIRLAFGAAFYLFGWSATLWMLVGSLLPDAMWCWERDKSRELHQHADALTNTISSLNTENASLLATVEAYQRRAWRASISSICSPVVWGGWGGPH
jgi:hypothetical protein